MATPSIQSTVQQMRVLALDAAGQNSKLAKSQAVETEGGGFIEELQSSIQRINELQQAAGKSVKAFEAGDSNMSLIDVMVDRQKAGLAFEMGIQVRNRLIQSYKEIMNMPV